MNQYDPDKVPGKSIVWAIVLFIVILGGVVSTAGYILSDPDLFYPYRLTSSLYLIDQVYPDPTSKSKLLDDARDEIFDQLDRYSGYIETKNYGRMREEFGGSYDGIGITVLDNDHGIMVQSVREDGPAGEAGIKTGDIIYRADSILLADYSLYDASFLLRGEDGTEVTLGIIRNRMSDTLSVVVERRNLRLIHIPYAGLTDDGIFYIRILDFEAGLFEQFKEIIDTAYMPNSDYVKGFIVDLRGNPGGFLTEVLDLADSFLNKGTLMVGVKGKSVWDKREFYASGVDIFEGKPMAILINRGSASASEIFAGSLKFAERAFLVGDTTFGKGLVQQYTGFGDGSGMRLTTSRYYFEGEQYINPPDAEVVDSGAGLAPDYYLKPISYEPYLVKLESSGLLRQFAIDNSSEIARYAPMTNNSDLWFDKFYKFLDSSDFKFESDLTEIARETKNETMFASMSEETYRAAVRLLDLAESEDRKLALRFRDYIEARLFRIAVESQFGISAGYKDAVVPYDNEINYAKEILLEK